jgi:hypothetical protein
VASTSQTRVRRAPGRDGCGTRVHTFPDALATSIAQTRPRICSCSSSSTSWASLITGTLSSRKQARLAGCPGASVGNRESNRRARSNNARPIKVITPGARLMNGLAPQGGTGVGGQPASIFTPARTLVGVARRDTRTNEGWWTATPEPL